MYFNTHTHLNSEELFDHRKGCKPYDGCWL